MRPTNARSTRLRSRAGWSKQDVRRVLLGAAALILVGALLSTSVVQGKLAAVLQGKVAATPPPAQDTFREGSILFVSRNSNLCRKQMLDNKTGQIGDARLVNCNGGPVGPAGPMDHTTQVDAFRDGFQRK